MGQWRSRGRSATTVHIYGNKSIRKAFEMTLSLSYHRLGLEHARNGAPKVCSQGGWSSLIWNYACILDTQFLQLYLVNYPLCTIKGLIRLLKIPPRILTAQFLQQAHVSGSPFLLTQVYIIYKAKFATTSENIHETMQPPALFLLIKSIAMRDPPLRNT